MHVLELRPTQLGFLHPTPLIHRRFPSETFRKPAVVQLAVSLALYPHALLFSGREIYIRRQVLRVIVYSIVS